MRIAISQNTEIVSVFKSVESFLSELENKTNHPLKIIAVGDSLVYGYGDFIGGGWVERLRRQWMKPGSRERILYNLGIRGDKAIDVRQRLETEFACRGELRRQRPDLIILSVGTNDSPRLRKPDGRLFTEFEEFKKEINNLLDLSCSLAPVLFIGMPPVDEKKMPFAKSFYFNHLDQYRYKEVTKRACQEKGIPYLDIFDIWLARGKDWLETQYGDDGLHPNVVGYENLLQDILNWTIIKN